MIQVVVVVYFVRILNLMGYVQESLIALPLTKGPLDGAFFHIRCHGHEADVIELRAFSTDQLLKR